MLNADTPEGLQNTFIRAACEENSALILNYAASRWRREWTQQEALTYMDLARENGSSEVLESLVKRFGSVYPADMPQKMFLKTCIHGHGQTAKQLHKLFGSLKIDSTLVRGVTRMCFLYCGGHSLEDLGIFNELIDIYSDMEADGKYLTGVLTNLLRDDVNFIPNHFHLENIGSPEVLYPKVVDFPQFSAEDHEELERRVLNRTMERESGRTSGGSADDEAIRKNSFLSTIQRLLSLGAFVEGDAPSNTLLTYAIKRSDMDIVRVLLDNGATLQPKSPGSQTPLERAASRAGGAEILKLLLERSVDLNIENDGARTSADIFPGLLMRLDCMLDGYSESDVLEKSRSMVENGLYASIKVMLDYDLPLGRHMPGLVNLLHFASFVGDEVIVSKLLRVGLSNTDEPREPLNEPAENDDLFDVDTPGPMPDELRPSATTRFIQRASQAAALGKQPRILKQLFHDNLQQGKKISVDELDDVILCQIPFILR